MESEPKKNTRRENWDRMAKAESREAAFVEYVENIIKEQEETKEDLMQSGYRVCAAISFDELMKVPEFYEIIDVACNLEIPRAQRKGKYQVDDEILWDEIKKSLTSYKSRQDK